MNLCVHDFSGHPFQAELARKLARDGHRVTHVSARQYVSGKGHLERLPDDPETIDFVEIAVDVPFDKYSPVRRIKWEIAYGRAWVRHLRQRPADVVIMCNVPLFAMAWFVLWARRTKLPWVFWHQDICSRGLGAELHRKFPRPLAALGARVFEAMEAWYARSASHVIAIGEAFTRVYPRWRVRPERVSVIPNWAPLDKIVPTDRDNHRTGDLFDADGGTRLLYAGTLGRKHNPMLLVDLLRDLHEAGVKAQLSVITEGEAAADLTAAGQAEPDLALRVLPFQPAADLPYVLGSADILVGLLEPDATLFSIPSKVLSYLAAGRPVAGLMPADNQAAVDIVAAGGIVADPTPAGAQRVAEWVGTLDSEQITAIGRQSRALAEERFNLDTIAAQFTTILSNAVAGR